MAGHVIGMPRRVQADPASVTGCFPPPPPHPALARAERLNEEFRQIRRSASPFLQAAIFARYVLIQATLQFARIFSVFLLFQAQAHPYTTACLSQDRGRRNRSSPPFLDGRAARDRRSLPASLVKTRVDLAAENLVLRHQIDVLRRRIPKRPTPTSIDRQAEEAMSWPSMISASAGRAAAMPRSTSDRAPVQSPAMTWCTPAAWWT